MGGPLVTNFISFYPKDNAKEHNTSRYEDVNPAEPRAETSIVRRGQPFNGVIAFDRPYNCEEDIVQMVFTIGDQKSLENQMETRGSVFVTPNVTAHKHHWSAKFVNANENYLYVEVSSPVDAPVGLWALEVITKLKTCREQERYELQSELYILFNPWNPDDQTYMPDTMLLQEYVLNDVGKIWKGNSNSTKGTPWVFGQFDSVVLPAVMFLLDRLEMPYHQRGDVVKLVRVISAAVNENSDDSDGGVLIGRWDGEYGDGTPPYLWTSSLDILAEYYRTGNPVSYGQCWVFAGIVNTVCRALGIPSRVVSNMNSGHDVDKSLSIDKYYSEDMESLKSGDYVSDSTWNYHVWNEVWMSRPDLPAGYGGWQAIDATPQEKSDNKYQCGPASVEAIKQGYIGFNYDVDFMLASVNADVFHWREDPSSATGHTIFRTQTDYVGLRVLTKKPHVYDPHGDADKEDITEQYKYREGTYDERIALMKGVNSSARAKRHYFVQCSTQNDIKFKLRNIATVLIGRDFNITVDLENTSDHDRHIKATVSAHSLFYNGVKAHNIVNKTGTITVRAHKVEKIDVPVRACEYLPKLVEYSNMKISAMAIVEETKQAWAQDDDFRVIKPEIDIKILDDLVVGQPAKATLSFGNPLDYPLTRCQFRLTSTGIMGRTINICANDVGANGYMKVDVIVTPNKVGMITLVSTFASRELHDINGSASVEVYEG